MLALPLVVHSPRCLGHSNSALQPLIMAWVAPTPPKSARFGRGPPHPNLPGVPRAKLTVDWIPARPLGGYLTGVAALACGIGILAKTKSRLTATCLGMEIFFAVLLVYLLTLVVHPSDIGNEMNYFPDTVMFSETIQLLASALPKEDQAEQVVTPHAQR